MPAHTRPTPSQPANRTTAWLQTLAQASQPLTLSALFGRSATAADKAGLAPLLACGEVVNLAKGRAFALATRADATGRFAPLNLAREAVLRHLGLGLKPLPLASAALDRFAVAPWVRPHLRPAVMALVAQGLVVPVKLGNASFVVGTAGIEHHLAQLGASLSRPPGEPSAEAAAAPVATLAPQPAPQPTLLTEAAVRQAYAQALPPGGSMLEIGALQRQLGCELAALHALLRHMLEAQQLFLVQGEPTVLSAADQAAGLTLDGRRYHCVELCPA